MKRRDFLKTAGAASASTLLPAASAKAAIQEKAKVYQLHNPAMVDGDKPDRKKVNEAPVQAAVDALVMAMTGEKEVGKAWEAVYPGITKTSKIAIKVNALYPGNAPQFATLKAVATGLGKMLGGTFPVKNITAFDNNLWQTAKLAKAYTAEKMDSLGITWKGEDGYSHAIRCNGVWVNVSVRWHSADYHMNLVAPRPHRGHFGGLSGFVKNMMGAVSRYKHTYQAEIGPAPYHFHFHGRYNNTYPAYVDLFKYINANNKCVYLGDMIMIPKNESCDYMEKVANKLIFGTDPVATDTQAIENITGSGILPAMGYHGLGALVRAGLGTFKYDLVEVEPPPVTRRDVQSAIKDLKDGSGSEAATQKVISDYLGT